MALIYQKLVDDKTLILDAKEALLYPFNVGTWTDIRLGFWLSATTAAADNAAVVNESILTSALAVNLYAVGIKNSSNQAIPKTATAVFGGISNVDATSGEYSNCIGDGTDTRVGLHSSASFANWTHLGNSIDTTPYVTEHSNARIVMPVAATMATSTNFCQFLGLRFTLQNRGAASQAMKTELMVAGVTSTPTVASLTAALATFGTVAATSGFETLNSGGAAVAVPDAIFFRWPFTTVRARIHALAILRFS